MGGGNMRTYWKVKVGKKVVAEAVPYDTMGKHETPWMCDVFDYITETYAHKNKLLMRHDDVKIERVPANSLK
jgi:type III secretory pathway component EscU